MVTKPNLPVPPAPTGLKKLPKIDPPIQVAGNTMATSLPKGGGKNAPVYRDADSGGKDLANKDHDSSFKLPEKVSQSEIKEQSFRYGGGRSAGNRSIADNINRKVDEQ